MPSIISAGTTTGTALSLTSDTSGELQIKTNNGSTTALTLTTGGAATFTAGTVSAPAITTSGDTNTGIFFPAADTIAFTEGGTESMRIDSSGNVGIGTSSPVSIAGYTIQTLNNGTSGSGTYYQQAATSIGRVLVTSTEMYVGSNGAYPLILTTNAAERMRIDSSGNVGIGTSSPAQKLTLGANNAFRMQTGSVTMDCTPTPGGIDGFVWNVSAGYYDWAIGGTSRMRIDSSGNLLVGRTSAIASEQLGIGYDGAAKQGMYITDSSSATTVTMIGFYKAGNARGSITSTSTATSFNTSSDYRLKDITGSLTGYKERIMALQPKQGTWKADGSVFKGFVAHEFAEQYPNAVSGEKDAVDAEGKPQYQGMQAGGSETIADLVALAKEQQAIITDLKARIEAIESK